MSVELVAYLIVVVVALVLTAVLARGSGVRLWLTVGTVVYVSFFALLTRGSSTSRRLEGGPKEADFDGYVSSDTCFGCHPGQYHSWKRSFHHSMTARPDPTTIIAPWEGASLQWRGRSYEILSKGDSYRVRLPDPAQAARASAQGRSLVNVPSVEREVLLVTGSHHYQAYWVRGERGNELYQFPFVYHLESERFIPRHDAFLQPPDAKPHYARWNSNCVMCHSVAGQPRHDPVSDEFDTRVAELGIACEACHGPGAKHVAHHKSPLSRYRQRESDTPDPTIVNPARLDASLSSQVCGQCHAYFVPKSPQSWWNTGFTRNYRPGRTLARSRVILDYETHKDHADSLISSSIDSIFFRDGTIRVGGREYNGLIRSPCYEHGDPRRRLGCLSCHRMHGDDPVDQLTQGMSGDRACTDCHPKTAAMGSGHTHHAPDSPGSRCMNCHMPYTTYALFKAIRSHRITSPNASRTLETDTPNACNLCHLDQTLNWTARALFSWYGQAPVATRGDRANVSHAVLGLLEGDAAMRVVTAWAMGWDAARKTSGGDWQAPLLAELLVDPYSAVRFVAYRSLRSLPAGEGFDYDFLAPEAVRLQKKNELQKRAKKVHRPKSGSALPYRPGGELDIELVRRILAERDDRPISISE